MRITKAEQEAIILRESENTDSIYLYPDIEEWVIFGNSIVHFCELLNDKDVYNKHVNEITDNCIRVDKEIVFELEHSCRIILGEEYIQLIPLKK